MVRYSRILCCIIALICIFSTLCSAETSVWTRDLAQGIKLTQIVNTNPPGKTDTKIQFINIVTADPKVAGVKVKTILAQEQVLNEDVLKGREIVSSMVKRTGAVAGVNGDYHNWIGDMDNVFIRDGELISDPWSIRPVFAVRKDGSFIIDKLLWDAKVMASDGSAFEINGINKIPDYNNLLIYTPTFYKKTLTEQKRTEAVVQVTSGLPAKVGVPIKGKIIRIREGNSPIEPGFVVLSGLGDGTQFINNHLKAGTEVTIEMNLISRETGSWADVMYAVGGCPWIVRGGKFYMDAPEEHVVPAFSDVDNPRTAVGKTADGKIVIATIDGRQSTAAGMSLQEVAALMISQGCVEAINLDGGGSTAMAVQTGVLNSPSDGWERATATGLAVYGKSIAKPGIVPDFAITPITRKLTAGDKVQLSLIDKATGKPLSSNYSDQAIWTTDGKIGAIDQSGKFYALKAHTGKITASISGKTTSIPVNISAGGSSRILASLTPSKKDENTDNLFVSIRDKNWNPVSWAKVSLKVTGGTVEKTEVSCSDDGWVELPVKWDGAYSAGQQVEVHCGDLATTVARKEKK